MLSFAPLTKYEKASFLAHNALHGRLPINPTDTALFAGRIYHNYFYRSLYLAATLGLCLLAIWEPIVQLTFEGKAEVIGKKRSEGTLSVLRGLDGAALCLVLGDLVLQYFYYGFKSAKRAWIILKAVVLLALFCNWVAVVAVPLTPYWTRALRPLLVFERLRSVRKIAGNVVRSAPDIFNAGALMLIAHVFFTVLGVVLFQGIGIKFVEPPEGMVGDPEKVQSCTPLRGDPMPNPLGCTAFWDEGCKFFFNSIDESSIQLFALLTGAANHPNVMLPYYECNKNSAFFFVFYFSVTCYLFATMLLAVASNAFSNQNREEVLLKYTRALGGLDVAYAVLTGGNVGMVAGEVVEESRNREGLGSPYAPPPPSSPRATPSPLKLPDLVSFMAVFSPTMSPGCVEKLAGVVEPGCVPGGLAPSAPVPSLSRSGFKALLLAFGRLRTATKAGTPAAAREESEWGEDRGPYAGVLARTVRSIMGREAALYPAPSSRLAAAIEDAEWLDGDSLGSTSSSSSKAGGSASWGAGQKWASGAAAASVVALNPLAAAAAASPGAAVAAAAEGSADPVSTGSTAEGSSSSSSSTGSLNGEGGGVEEGLPRILAPASPSSSAADKLEAWGEGRKAAGSTGSSSSSSSPSSFLSYLTPSALYSAFTRSALSLPPANPHIPPSPSNASLLLVARERLAGWLSSPPAHLLFDGAIVTFCIGELWLLQADASQPGLIASLTTLELVCGGIFLGELAAKMLVWGPLAYARSAFAHQVDLVVLCVGFGLGVSFLTGGIEKESALSILFLRAFRLMRYLFVLPGFGSTAAATLDLGPVLLRYLAVVVGCMYAFAIVGCQVFAGRLDEEKWPAVEKSSYGQGEMAGVLNFDSFPNAMVVLVYQMFMNDWPVIMEGLVFSHQSTWPRAYFVLYLIVVVAVVLNVVCVCNPEGGFPPQYYSLLPEKIPPLPPPSLTHPPPPPSPPPHPDTPLVSHS